MRVYLAGPDVFEPNPKELAEKLKSVCQKFGLEGVFPLDADLTLEGLAPKDQARLIFDANVRLIRSCQGVLANMTPFRGPSMDVGTSWEMGCAYALGLPIVGYTNDDRPYPERVEDFRERNLGLVFKDPKFVESFELHDNLMLDCSTLAVLPTFKEAVEKIRDRLLGEAIAKSWAPEGTCTCRVCYQPVKVRPSTAQDYLWFCTNNDCQYNKGEDRYTQDDQPVWADWRKNEGSQTGS
jgi:nucleoside 2-deoxyribosyltransferase